MEQSKAFLYIMFKYNIYSITNAPHHSQQNPTERRIQVYKKGTNTTIYQTVATSYMWLYILLIWYGISNCLNDPYHGNWSDHEIAFGTTPGTNQVMHYTLWDPFY